MLTMIANRRSVFHLIYTLSPKIMAMELQLQNQSMKIRKNQCSSWNLASCDILSSFYPPTISLYHFHVIMSTIFYKFIKISAQITHNVPAVGDVLPARIRALRSKDQGWQNVPEQRRGNEA
jgi:hypothetical protein